MGGLDLSSQTLDQKVEASPERSLSDIHSGESRSARRGPTRARDVGALLARIFKGEKKGGRRRSLRLKTPRSIEQARVYPPNVFPRDKSTKLSAR